MAIKQIKIKQNDGTFISTPIEIENNKIKINDENTLDDKISDWDNKVDKEENKILVTNDYTNDYKEKLTNIEEKAEENKIEKIKVNNKLQEINEDGEVDIILPNTENLTPIMHISAIDEYGAGTEEKYGHVKIGNLHNQAVRGNDQKMNDKRVPLPHNSETDKYGLATKKLFGHAKAIPTNDFQDSGYHSIEICTYFDSNNTFNNKNLEEDGLIMTFFDVRCPAAYDWTGRTSENYHRIKEIQIDKLDGWLRSSHTATGLTYLLDQYDKPAEEREFSGIGQHPGVSLLNDPSILLLKLDDNINSDLLLEDITITVNSEFENFTVPFMFNRAVIELKYLTEYTITENLYGNSITVTPQQIGDILSYTMFLKRANLNFYTSNKNLYSASVKIFKNGKEITYWYKGFKIENLQMVYGTINFHIFEEGDYTIKILNNDSVISTSIIHINELDKDYNINIDEL